MALIIDSDRIVRSLLSVCLSEQAVREAATICPRPCKLTFNLESGVRVACDVGYLCANFSLLLCSRLRPDVRDRRQTARQTDVRQHHRSYAACSVREDWTIEK